MSRMKRGVLWFTTMAVLALAALSYSAFLASNRHKNTLRLVEVVKQGDNADEVEVRALLAGGADPNASLTPRPFTRSDKLRATLHLSRQRDPGESLVMHAAGSCKDRVLRDLLEAGGDRNTLFEGQTTLVTAILSARHRNVEVLVQHGADVNLSGPSGGTPLLAATVADSLDDLSVLLAYGADPNGAVDNDGMTPLMLAASLERTKERTEVMDALLRAGAKVNMRTKDGMSALDFAQDHDAAGDEPGKRRQAEVNRLLKEARAIVSVKPKEDWTWLTDDKLLVITTEQEGDWAGSQSWQGHFELFDRRTGLRSPLPGLTALFRRSDISPLGAPVGMELSPGNTWLVWRNYVTADGYPFPAAAHLDGTHYREWGIDKQDIGFFLDDRRYVQETGDEAFSLIVHNLQSARKDRTYPRTAPEAKSILAFQSRNQPYFLERNNSHSEKEDVELDLYRSEDTLPVRVAYRYPNRKPPSPIKKMFVRLPKEAHLLDWDVSPKQDRILYHLQRSRENPVAARLHRLFPHIEIPPNVTEAIWTSRLDGSQMHEIGYVEAPAPAADLRQSQEDSPKNALESVQWTPNGQQIRFVYRGILSIVPVEGGQP